MKLSEKMILLALEDRRMTVQQLIDRCRIADITVRQGLRQLHADKAVHIQTWTRSKNSQWMGVWTLGQGEDAPKPACLKKAPPPPRRRHPTVDAIAKIVAASEGFNPFACLIGQMGAEQ